MKLTDIEKTNEDILPIVKGYTKYKKCIKDLEELLRYHRNSAAEEGTSVNGIDLADDLESFIEQHKGQ